MDITEQMVIQNLTDSPESSTTILTISGTECIGDSLPKINNNFALLANFVAPNYTAAHLASLTHEVNNIDKRPGKVVFDTTNCRLMVASGSNADSPWYIVDGTYSVTPV